MRYTPYLLSFSADNCSRGGTNSSAPLSSLTTMSWGGRHIGSHKVGEEEEEERHRWIPNSRLLLQTQFTWTHLNKFHSYPPSSSSSSPYYTFFLPTLTSVLSPSTLMLFLKAPITQTLLHSPGYWACAWHRDEDRACTTGNLVACTWSSSSSAHVGHSWP